MASLGFPWFEGSTSPNTSWIDVSSKLRATTLADIVVLQSPRMVELVAPHDESLKVLQGKEKQHKDVKSCVGFLQLTE